MFWWNYKTNIINIVLFQCSVVALVKQNPLLYEVEKIKSKKLIPLIANTDKDKLQYGRCRPLTIIFRTYL
jgi:hypothetical protein